LKTDIKSDNLAKGGEIIGNAYCGPSNYLTKEEDCTSMFDIKEFNKTFQKICYNRPSCEFDLNDPKWLKTSKAPKGMEKKCSHKFTSTYM
jgi:hypothetical protein